MRRIKFQLNETLVSGDLDFENRCIILDLSIYKSLRKELNDCFNESNQFNIFGEFDDDENKISIFGCSVVSLRLYSETKIHFLQLYTGDIHIKDNKNQEVNKVIFQISHVNNLPSINSFIIQENFSLTILDDNTFQISVENPISIDEINKIIFELKTFFQIITLDITLELDKKIFYTQNNEEIALILKNIIKENNKNIDKLIILEKPIITCNQAINRLIRLESISEKTLIKWFDTKNKFGKIFDYLSAIFNKEASIYLEIRYFLLIQWIEAYCGVLYKSGINEKKIEKEKKIKLTEIIDQSNLSEEDKQDFKDNTKYDKQGHIFSKKLKLLFDENKTLKDLFNSDKTLLDDIKHYRNNLTHINVADNLENKQIHHLHEILKNTIYILIIEELELPTSRFYDDFKKEAKRYFGLYKDMKK